MEFFATNGSRPIRLCDTTRQFAYESLNHKYGQETWDLLGVPMDDTDFAKLSPLAQYDLAIERIVQTAPIRICENEKVSGAATYGWSIGHYLPATLNGEKQIMSISHITIDFETVLKKGINYIQQQADEALSRYVGTEKEDFARSCVHCLQCMRVWHKRYVDALREMPEYQANYENLLRVPFETPRNFYEAVQSLWFTFAFVRLCGNWPGIGRIDWLLGEYLEKDLAEGVLTLEEAREILAHFFIKGCEWVKGGNYGSGDAQHYQNILLGGIDEDGNDTTNAVTYLVLDILEELGISDFPTTVRINKNTSHKLLSRVAEVIRLGGGVLAIYNEDLIIQSLVDYGYDLREARKFANDGCWEIQIPGKTYFSYIPFDSLGILQRTTLQNYDGDVSFADFDSLYQQYAKDLDAAVVAIMDEWYSGVFDSVQGEPSAWVRKTGRLPCTIVSLFEQGCIERGASYLEGGTIYTVVSPHIGGLPDTVNSLYAIKKLVFDEKKITFQELMQVLKNNWEGYETLRLYALNNLTYFGNDNDEVDAIAQRIIDDLATTCDRLDAVSPCVVTAGVSTFGRQLEWRPFRLATPYGKTVNSILAHNFSPAPGTDKAGATAIIRSYCKCDLLRTGSGAALDIKLLPSAVNGENGIEAIASLIRGFVALGGHFMQLDIADTQLLKAAQENPEEYQNLSVRVSGWNARFVTLDKEWQQMIIEQTGSGM